MPHTVTWVSGACAPRSDYVPLWELRSLCIAQCLPVKDPAMPDGPRSLPARTGMGRLVAIVGQELGHVFLYWRARVLACLTMSAEGEVRRTLERSSQASAGPTWIAKTPNG